MAEQLAVCHQCEMIGPVAAGRAHEIARGHEVEVLSREKSAAVFEQWEEERAERVQGLVALARLRSASSTQPPATPGDQGRGS